MAFWRKLIAPLFCCIIFVVTFISLKNSWIVVRDITPGPEYGLLLFLLPGLLTGLIYRDSPIFSSLIGALISVPVCTALRMMFYPRVRPLVQEVAYATSAIFWCVLGAMLIQLLFTAYKQFRQHR